ncbi:GL22183 [Drosophila persimilis]|uniref:GL22183 n=1 Tax=Drosophila persimilis TaxID=7234 RepID=B4GFC7_DROPE|nr:GL22183 [Drosophila persimilis]
MLKNPKIVKTSPSTVKTAPPGKAAAKSFDVAQVCSVDLGSDGGVRLPPLTLQSRVEPEDVVDARFRLVEARSQTVVLTDRQFDVHLKRLVKVFMSEVSITRDMRALNSKRSLQPADRLLLQDLEILKGKFKEERSNLVVTLSMDSRNRSKLNSTKEANTQSQDKHERPSDSADDVIPSTSKTSKLRKCSVPSRKQGGAQPKVPSNPPSNPVKTLSMGSRHRSQKSSTTEIQPEANNQDQKEEEPSDYFDVVTPSTTAPVTAPVAAPVTAPVAAPVAAPAAAPVAASVAAPVAARVTSSVSSTAKIKAKAKPKELSESLSDIFYDFPIAIY